MWIGILNKFRVVVGEKIGEAMTPGWSAQGSANFGQFVNADFWPPHPEVLGQ